MVDGKFSLKIKILSFIAMVNVIMIHSYGAGTTNNLAPWCIFIQTFLFRSITYFAVPFFFIVSGFFFGRGTYLSNGGYKALVLKKVRTLLVPYFLWAIIGCAISFPLIMCSNYIAHRGLLERTFLMDGGGWPAIDLFFGITGLGPKHNLALWYVRALLIMFFVAPLFRAIVKTVGGRACLALGVLLVLWKPGLDVPYVTIKLGCFGWFLLGIGLSCERLECVNISKTMSSLLIVLYVFASLVDAVGVTWTHLFNSYVVVVVKRIIPIIGCVAWFCMISFFEIKNLSLPTYMGMTFWTYCMHGGVAGWLLSGILFAIGKSNVSVMIASIATIIGTLLGCMVAGAWVRGKTPRLYNMLQGGRP